MTRVVVAAQLSDLATFVLAIAVLGVPIGLESNPLMVASYLTGGILLTLATKFALVAAMLALVARLDRDRRLGFALIGGIGLLGAASNVWTSLVWLQIHGV